MKGGRKKKGRKSFSLLFIKEGRKEGRKEGKEERK